MQQNHLWDVAEYQRFGDSLTQISQVPGNLCSTPSEHCTDSLASAYAPRGARSVDDLTIATYQAALRCSERPDALWRLLAALSADVVDQIPPFVRVFTRESRFYGRYRRQKRHEKDLGPGRKNRRRTPKKCLFGCIWWQQRRSSLVRCVHIKVDGSKATIPLFLCRSEQERIGTAKNVLEAR